MKYLKMLFLILCMLFIQECIFADDALNPYQIIIKLKNLPENSALAAIQPYLSDLEATINLKINEVKPMAGGAYIIAFTPEQIQQLAKKENVANDTAFNHLVKLLSNRNNVIYAVKDRIIKLDPKEIVAVKEPINVSASDQWDQKKAPDKPTKDNTPWGVNLAAAWQTSKGSNTIVVAVLDTGLADNVDLPKTDPNKIAPGYNFYDNNTDITDYGNNTSYHGTHVAGIIGATGTIFGMAPNIKILPILVLKPSSRESSVINGIYWAVNKQPPENIPTNPNPAKVLNLSLGGTSACDAAYQQAIDAAVATGTPGAPSATVVVAAGNENLDASTSSPANCNNVITVAATNLKGVRAPYSNYGSTVTIAAPGGVTEITDAWTGILSTVKNGYRYHQGTSQAAPHVAGIAALLYSIKPDATPTQIKSWLTSSVHSFSSDPSLTEFNCTGKKTCGAGIVDAGAAVAKAKASL